VNRRVPARDSFSILFLERHSERGGFMRRRKSDRCLFL
jgi:hypothetical protein